jgi:flagellar hook-basal body complex protein FliE
MLERIGTVPGRLPEATGTQKRDSGKPQEKPDFVETLKKFMSEVNSLQKEAGESIQRLASGDINNIHEVMVAIEKASVSFELMMEIRNKVLEAYREVMRMQV